MLQLVLLHFGLLNFSLYIVLRTHTPIHSFPFLRFHSLQTRTFSVTTISFHFILYTKIDKFCLFHFRNNNTKKRTAIQYGASYARIIAKWIDIGETAETIAICQNNQFIIANKASEYALVL